MHGPVQSAYSRTEKAATAESGVCRVFDRAPVAGSNRKVVIGKRPFYFYYFIRYFQRSVIVDKKTLLTTIELLVNRR